MDRTLWFRRGLANSRFRRNLAIGAAIDKGPQSIRKLSRQKSRLLTTLPEPILSKAYVMQKLDAKEPQLLRTIQSTGGGFADPGRRCRRDARRNCSPYRRTIAAAGSMLKRYGGKALEQSRTRIDELAADGDHDGADSDAGSQLPLSSSPTPPGPLH